MPLTQPPTAATAHLNALLTARYSCRAYLPDAIPKPVIAAIVKTAQRVPSWCNAQPWQVTVTCGTSTETFRRMLVKATQTDSFNSDIAFPKQYTGIYKERRSTVGWQLYKAVGVTPGDRVGSARQMAENFTLFGAPHVAIVTTEADLGTYGVLDCGAFVTAFMLAAQAAGVASIAQASIAGYGKQVRAFFNIPDNRQVVCAISFGREDPDHAANGFKVDRAHVDEVIDWRD